MTDAELLAEIEAVTPKPTRGEARGRGLLQGGSLMFGDEASGGVAALASTAQTPWSRTPGPRALAKAYPGVPYAEAASRWFNENRPDVESAGAAERGRLAAPAAYVAERDKQRAANEAAREAHPGTFLGYQIMGAAPAIVATGGAGLAGSALLGAAQGAGSSDANSVGGLLGDTAVGGGLGALGHGAATLAGGAARGLLGFAKNRLGQALARQTADAAEAKAAALHSAGSTLGNARAEANRVVEAIRFLAQEETLTAAQQAELAALKANPAYPEAVETLIGSLKGRLPAVAGKVAQAEAGVAAAQGGKSVSELAAEGVSRKAAWERGIKPRLLRYGPVAAGTIAGTMFGGPVGSAVGALAGAGTRPMIRATLRGIKDPAVQTMLWKPVAGAAQAGASAPGRALTMSLARAGAAPLMPAASDAAAGIGNYLTKSKAEREAEAELARLLAD